MGQGRQLRSAELSVLFPNASNHGLCICRFLSSPPFLTDSGGLIAILGNNTNAGEKLFEPTFTENGALRNFGPKHCPALPLFR